MARRASRNADSPPKDALWAVIGAIAFSLLSPTVARAYVDPSVVTYTIQAIAGVAVAAGAVLGVALRRSRRIIFRILHIDENANKAVDPEVHRLEEDDPAALGEARDRAVAFSTSLAAGRPAKRLGWSRRFLRALLGSAFLVFTVLVFAPLEVVAASSQSLLFGLFDITALVFGMGAAITVILALLLSIARGRAFDVLLTLVVALGLCCYVQALFLNSSLPVADGQGLDLANHLAITLASTVAWAAIVAGLLVFDARRTALCRAFVLVVSALLLVVQGVSMVGVAQGEADEIDSQNGLYSIGYYGLDEVGAEDNVTVFVLDMFDTRTLDRVLKDDPAVLDEFTGFTWFRNATGSVIPTGWAIPYLLSGAMPEEGEDYEAYLDRRYEGGLLDRIEGQGYEICAFSDSFNPADIEPYAANVHPTATRPIDRRELWPILARVALYRDGPWLLKPLFWFWTDELNQTLDDSFFMNDVLYAEGLRENGLSISENADRTFRFIHLLGAHWPYVMDREGHRVARGEGTEIGQAEGSLLIVADYLAELKRLGVYDQSTVIVTADHGQWTLPDSPLREPTSPIFLVKPAETAAEAAKPLTVSEVPTGHIDYEATVLEPMGADLSDVGPTAFDIPEGPRVRPYWMTLYDGEDYTWREYLIDGDVLDFDDWKLTDETIETTERR